MQFVSRMNYCGFAFVSMLMSSMVLGAGVPLQCGHVAGFRTAATIQNASGARNLQLTFFDRHPSTVKVQSALRECVALAAKQDESVDILGTVWLHKAGTRESDDNQIDIFHGQLQNVYVRC